MHINPMGMVGFIYLYIFYTLQDGRLFYFKSHKCFYLDIKIINIVLKLLQYFYHHSIYLSVILVSFLP